MKKIFLYFCLFCLSSHISVASEDNKQKVSSRYKTITYDVFGGLMYGFGFHGVHFFDSTAKINTGNLSLLVGIDVYIGGYYDKVVKRYREYLIVPMAGVQFDYSLTNSNKTQINTMQIKNNLNLLFRLGALFKLKFDTNVKLYFLIGMTYNHVYVSNNVMLEYLAGNEFSKVSLLNAVYGFGLDFTIKQHFLLGFEYRVAPLYKKKILLMKQEWNSWFGDYVMTGDELDIIMQSFVIKAGFAF